jgi:hypothetical protein
MTTSEDLRGPSYCVFAAARRRSPLVMAGFIPAIHVLGSAGKKDVDARVKPGHDDL